jgi:hypothetical protein
MRAFSPPSLARPSRQMDVGTSKQWQRGIAPRSLQIAGSAWVAVDLRRRTPGRLTSFGTSWRRYSDAAQL